MELIKVYTHLFAHNFGKTGTILFPIMLSRQMRLDGLRTTSRLAYCITLRANRFRFARDALEPNPSAWQEKPHTVFCLTSTFLRPPQDLIAALNAGTGHALSRGRNRLASGLADKALMKAPR